MRNFFTSAIQAAMRRIVIFFNFKLRFQVWQINCYLTQRRNGQSREIALRKAWVAADTLALRIEQTLLSVLPSVGVFIFPLGGTSSLEQSALLIRTIGDLAPKLSPELRERFHRYMEQLSDHNWGGIRAPAIEASKDLEIE